MSHERSDRILEEWRALASSAARPADPPKSVVRLTAGDGVAVVIASLVILLLVVVIRPPDRSANPGVAEPSVGLSPGQSGAVATPSAATATGSASPTAPEISPTPSAQSPAPGSPVPDAALAATLVRDYEAALVADHPEVAWALLGREAQEMRGSEKAFAIERRQFLASVKGRVEVGEPSDDPATLQNWLQGYRVVADMTRAFIVRVDFPEIPANTNANYEILLAAPDSDGQWRIWPVR